MILESISSIENAEDFCKENFFDSSPFLKYSFFKLLEDSNCTDSRSGWIPQHIIIKEKNQIIGFIPNFKKLNSFGEYIFDHMFEHAYYQVGSDYFPKFLSGIPFTPVNRMKFIYSKNILEIENVAESLKIFVRKKKISSFHANFISKNVSKELEQSDFFKRIGIQYHWENKSFRDFQDFLDSMKSRKKKNIQKERNFLKDKKIEFVHKQGDMITEKDITNLYKCYINTIDKKWSRPYLNLDFFKRLINSSSISNILLISAYKKDNLLGSSLHFIGDDTLYGRYWGCLENIAYLHFELCYYQAIDYAIKKKISKIEAGAQGEHKISRGYLPCLTYSNHWFDNEKLRKPIKDFLQKENQKVLEASRYLDSYSPFAKQSG